MSESPDRESLTASQGQERYEELEAEHRAVMEDYERKLTAYESHLVQLGRPDLVIGGGRRSTPLYIYWCSICRLQSAFSWHVAWNPRTSHHECVRIEVVALNEGDLDA